MNYRIYIVSIWPEPPQTIQTPIHWRFRVEDPHTGAQYGFGSARALADFLAAPDQFSTRPPAPNEFQTNDGYPADIGNEDSDF